MAAPMTLPLRGSWSSRMVHYAGVGLGAVTELLLIRSFEPVAPWQVGLTPQHSICVTVYFVRHRDTEATEKTLHLYITIARAWNSLGARRAR